MPSRQGELLSEGFEENPKRSTVRAPRVRAPPFDRTGWVAMRRATSDDENASVSQDPAQCNAAAAANALASGATADPRQGPIARSGVLGPSRRQHAHDALPPMHAHALPLSPYRYSPGSGAQREFHDAEVGVMYLHGPLGSEMMWRHEWPDGKIWHMHGDRGNEYCHCVVTPGGNRQHMS